MYKIYINEVPVTFCVSEIIKLDAIHKGSKFLYEYKGKIKQLNKIIQLCEGPKLFDEVILHSKNIEKLITDFVSLHTIVEAAGGLIKNEKGEYLFIFRRGFWDLPKGKLDKNETKKEAAIREVKEETGIKSPVIIDKINISYHTFIGKSGKRILKKSHWYLMEAKKQNLIPQKDEDIDLAEWLTLEELKKKSPVYGNIYQTILEYQQLENR